MPDPIKLILDTLESYGLSFKDFFHSILFDIRYTNHKILEGIKEDMGDLI